VSTRACIARDLVSVHRGLVSIARGLVSIKGGCAAVSARACDTHTLTHTHTHTTNTHTHAHTHTSTTLKGGCSEYVSLSLSLSVARALSISLSLSLSLSRCVCMCVCVCVYALSDMLHSASTLLRAKGLSNKDRGIHPSVPNRNLVMPASLLPMSSSCPRKCVTRVPVWSCTGHTWGEGCERRAPRYYALEWHRRIHIESDAAQSDTRISLRGTRTCN
jgi:hypothetical protein